VRALARSERSATRVGGAAEFVFGNVTSPESLRGVCRGVEVVISTIGITRQKDGLTYEEVDYQGNVNLLREAEANGVKKFLYVSVFNAEQMLHLKIVQANERFVRALRTSTIPSVIVRPNGFFSDMKDFLAMAAKGRVYLFGKGTVCGNPIHGADLARYCAEVLTSTQREHAVGGPVVYTQREIAEAAFRALGKEPRIASIPVVAGSLFVGLLRLTTSSRVYGPIEFFVEVLSRDMIAPAYGTMVLTEFFELEAKTLQAESGARRSW
jgi:uncharacterized protein YbjT (DUF2867 family)